MALKKQRLETNTASHFLNALQLKKIEIGVAVFILLFSVGLRIQAPTADLPSHVTFSGSILTDEGNQCHNSRSKALYDEWYPDDWRITNYNPVLPWIKLAVFKVFGVGMLQMRLVSHLFAALALLFFYLTFKSYLRHNFKFALLGALFLGVNFLFVMYNKIGTFETSITFWVILTLYFIEKYRMHERPVYLLLTGASAFMAFIFKSIMAYLLPLPFAAYLVFHLFAPKEKKLPLKRAAYHLVLIAGGMMMLFIPWLLFHYLPNREWIVSAPGQFMGNLMFPRSLDSALDNFVTFPWKDQFYKIPVIWLGAVLYIPLFFRRLAAGKATLTETGATLFFFSHTFIFFFMSYRPTRYFVPVIPAMVFMAVLLMVRWRRRSRTPGPVYLRYRPLERGLLFAADTLWLALAAYFCLIPLFSRFILSIPRPPLSVYYFTVSALLVGLAHLTGFLAARFSWKPLQLGLRPPLTPLIIFLIIASLTSDAYYYIQWHIEKTHSIRDMSRELGKELDDAYIGGMTSTVAVLENRHKALWLYPNFVNWDAETFEKYPMTHALLGTDVSDEVIHFFTQWPERMNRAALLKVYPIKDYFLHLYSFRTPYIKHCTEETAGNYRVTIINPTTQTKEFVKIGLVESPSTPVTWFERSVDLKPGENVVLITGESQTHPESSVIPGSRLIVLQYPRPFDARPLRYEGENFASKIGVNRNDNAASNGVIRTVDPGIHGTGFFSYGPAVPYGRGILTADFKISFKNMKTKLKTLCRIDIYAKEAEGPVAQWDIKPSDVKKSKDGTFRLVTEIPGVRTLEFRAQTPERHQAEISFDYVDVTYYQGCFIK